MSYLLKYISGWPLLLFFFLTNCNHPLFDTSSEAKQTVCHSKPIQRDLTDIIDAGKIVAITDNSSTSFFIYKGEPMGYEYELLKLFADHLGVELEIKISSDLNEILDQLNRGEGDIVAANMTVTKDRASYVNFTEHHLLTKQVLIQKLPAGANTMSASEIESHLIRNPIELIDKEIYVRKNSSFYKRLVNLSDEIGGNINIIETPGDYETEQLIKMVANGKIPFTIADENVAMNNKTYYPNIDIKTAISFPQKIAWAVRQNSPNLLYTLNSWIKAMRGNSEYAYIYQKYFRSQKDQLERVVSNYSSLSGNTISQYDIMIQNRSKLLNWDWRLLAAQIQQESRFKKDAVSWAGAQGLMQLMPNTAKQFGIHNIKNPHDNIKAGTLFIAWLDNYWCNKIELKDERIKFILASYNAGLGHVIDARNLTKKYGKDPNKWDNNVEDFLRLKSKEKYYNDEVAKYGYCRGEEPYNYVRQIINRYEYYKTVIS